MLTPVKLLRFRIIDIIIQTRVGIERLVMVAEEVAGLLSRD